MFRVLAIILVFLGMAARGSERVDYLREVKPVLAKRCYACHGALKQKGQLRADTAASLRKGGKHGPAIVPGDPDASRLIERISALDESERMPQEGEPLSSAQITAIRTWIAAGAPAPSDERPEADPLEHWAFRPPVESVLPGSSGSVISRSVISNQFVQSNPIDAFLEPRRREQGLTTQPPAAKSIWLRRVHLDLVGLPPTLGEIRAFEADESPGARETVVERLLASPHHGERWARHFMDIWRYCDWWGLDGQLRYSQKHIWHWRDWIVESLNSDKGYDQMIVEQLAGDELAPTDTDTLRATGFLARNYYLFNRTTWLDDVIEHTAKAFLGLTLNCAKCHDHKYDPLTQVDYYAWRAIFEPYHARLDELPGEIDLEKDGLPRVFDLHLDRPTYVHRKGDEKNLDQSTVIAPAAPVALAFKPLSIHPVALPPPAQHPALQPWVLSNHLGAAEKQIADARQSVEKARNKFAETEALQATKSETTQSSEDRKPELAVGVSPFERARSELAAAETALAAAELRPAMLRAVWEADAMKFVSTNATTDPFAQATRAATAEAKFKLAQCEADLAKATLDRLIAATNKTAEAEKKLKSAQEALDTARTTFASSSTNYTLFGASMKALEGPNESATNRALTYPPTSTGRRLALARWITDAGNPLTARVLVNHVWTRHFGQPLVPNVTDFGRRSPAPLHQDLLDWLAADFVENGWSLKRLHRWMVLSDTYGLSSSAPITRDPENRFYARMNAQRLDAHAIRDSLLSLAGTLDLKLGGPTVNPKQEDTAMRRSLYFTQSPEDLHKFLETFDNANTKECYRRAESILPQQALALANSKLASAAAAKLAERLAQSTAHDSDETFIRTAFETILAVKPAAAEYAMCVESLDKLLKTARERQAPQPEARARAAFVQALLNHNDFITVR